MTEPQAWVALLTLTVLEIVLGIDNIIFLSILADRVPPEKRGRVRRIGLLVAMGMRLVLLACLQWIMELTEPLFGVFGNEISGRDLVLIGGGLFLIGKSTLEIHHRIEGGHTAERGAGKPASVAAVLVQISLLDLVFSLDSVITAVGMAEHLGVMVVAVLISVGCMILFVDAICGFVDRNPTFKVLALAFLVLIGVALVGEGSELHIPKGYIYFAMAFAVAVESINLAVRRRSRGLGMRAEENSASDA